MIVGYARTSSLGQIAGLEAQVRELRQAGAERIFSEQISSVAQRDQLEQALYFCREGDSFTVTKLDRLARSVGDRFCQRSRQAIADPQMYWLRSRGMKGVKQSALPEMPIDGGQGAA